MTRQEEKTFLKGIYPDYDPRYHDMFVDRYTKEQEKRAFETWWDNRIKGLSQ